MLIKSLSIVTAVTLCSHALLYAEEIDMSGFTEETPKGRFDDTSIQTEKATSTEDTLMDGFADETPESRFDEDTSAETVDETSTNLFGFSGKLTQQLSYSLSKEEPHDAISSLRSSLLLDYEHKFENGWRIKANAKAYYDAIYEIRGTKKFSSQELDAFKSEVRLYDAYVEGSIGDDIDVKIGRQVVVWGRSDTIRVTDILNPLDNRRPAMADIEDLRLPVGMVKLDYFIGEWRVTPIVILEQMFSLNPPFGSMFSPLPVDMPEDQSYSDLTYALSVGGEFSGWDVNFYAAKVRNDAGKLVLPTAIKPSASIVHEKIEMYATALNVLTGSWLFKTELAYFDGLKYFTTGDKEFSRTDFLAGVEYRGIADTLISYDVVTRHIGSYDTRLITEAVPLKKDEYQHAFRISSDFLNATLTANYLISLYGKKLDEGGFQRAWVKYELDEGIYTNIGIVDYIGGSKLFNIIKNSDMVFADISYNF